MRCAGVLHREFHMWDCMTTLLSVYQVHAHLQQIGVLGAAWRISSKSSPFPSLLTGHLQELRKTETAARRCPAAQVEAPRMHTLLASRVPLRFQELQQHWRTWGQLLAALSPDRHAPKQTRFAKPLDAQHSIICCIMLLDVWLQSGSIPSFHADALPCCLCQQSVAPRRGSLRVSQQSTDSTAQVPGGPVVPAALPADAAHSVTGRTPWLGALAYQPCNPDCSPATLAASARRWCACLKRRAGPKNKCP